MVSPAAQWHLFPLVLLHQSPPTNGASQALRGVGRSLSQGPPVEGHDGRLCSLDMPHAHTHTSPCGELSLLWGPFQFLTSYTRATGSGVLRCECGGSSLLDGPHGIPLPVGVFLSLTGQDP